ncbi:MAG: tetratricopeptide repeat protein [Sphingobacteriales bacterium]|nr:MAG: tetratricopeptide repeat protein [Sphingobacteriales bacterium]
MWLKQLGLKSLYIYICVLFLRGGGLVASAQSLPVKPEPELEKISNKKAVSPKTGYNSNQLSKRAKQVEQSFGSDDAATATGFVQIGDDLTGKGEYQKAETYYKRATAIYQSSGSKEELANVQRKLAKVQEEQDKVKEAIGNYEKAASNQDDPLAKSLNANDLKRMQAPDQERKEEYARKNVEMLSQSKYRVPQVKVELSDALNQLAVSQSLQNKQDEALKTLSRAIAMDDQHTAGKEKVIEDLSKALVKDNKYDEAVSLQLTMLATADSTRNDLLKINTLIQLGTLYAQQNKDTAAEQNLMAAYQLATALHLTKPAKDALLQLVDFYNNSGRSAKAQQLSIGFLDNLDTLLAKDSSLLDMKAFDAIEGRIQKLEEEKALQATLLQQTRRNNYLLIAVALVILVSLVFIAKAYYTILKRNKKIRLQSLRREMNPHFVFNSLNSVNQFIAENDEIKANKYLSAYSTLMRTVMEHSGKDFIPLGVELDHLEKYLSLEYQRFSYQFNYEIQVDPLIDKMELSVPNMIIQPFLENAVWHGLRYKKGKGLLTLQIEKKDGLLHILIKDDGIGIEQSKALKTVHQKQHKSLGMENTRERIALLNQLYHTKIGCTITDLSAPGQQGTLIDISLPVLKYSYETEHA